MDCDAFDRVLLDSLYGELDELTEASARRHAQRCSRCATLGSKLRAAHELATLPLEPAPPRLKERILRAERGVQASLGLRQRFGRFISVLAGYAMRPQLGMAALLLLMIASSLLFLRRKPQGEPAMVTERGVPEGDHEAVIGPARAPSRSAGAAKRDAGARDSGAEPPGDLKDKLGDVRATPKELEQRYEQALKAYRARRFVEAYDLFKALTGGPGGRAARAALYAARALRGANGCARGAPELDLVARGFPATDSAREATWEAAECYVKLGKPGEAQSRYQSLIHAPLFSLRARRALERLESRALPKASSASAEATDDSKQAPDAGARDASSDAAAE